MNVLTGWSTEFAKLRFGLELEEAEFSMLCEEHDLDPDKFTVMEKFLFMYDQAQVISSMVKVSSGQWPGSEDLLAEKKNIQKERITVMRLAQASR